MQTIQVEIKSVFGREVIYPACEKASGFCQLVGQKSLTRGQVEQFKGLGYEVLVVLSHPVKL